MTAIDTSVAGVTVSVVEPEMLPNAADITAEPAVNEAASPFEPTASLTVAIAALDVDQVDMSVKSWVVLSE